MAIAEAWASELGRCPTTVARPVAVSIAWIASVEPPLAVSPPNA
jgi:hypothetical protein